MDHSNSSQEKTSTTMDVPAAEFRKALRELTGAVSVITVGNAEDRTGFVATSVSSFSTDPPSLILCINKTSSSRETLLKSGRFGVNFMKDQHADIADRFIGIGGIKGNDRYTGAEWITLPSGTQVLKEALASIECIVEETLDRHDHTIVIGKVESIRMCNNGKPLLWFQSTYYHIGAQLNKL
ncbi:flavin reductase family protein [Chitinophaga sp. S165]|uniref:flavin reductase family protein n=1 Tax=Chitinophaga sp. S165 TaxID=2135462 RepID=UPI000D713B48|nr:flavin reductase family protein [Chitinophaga sp. S165]PWV51555.1 flavin reductase (DIM6/NTAB) family NADH-FMN oxidoreductase RutF [Chitinophaga sp. S165]